MEGFQVRLSLLREGRPSLVVLDEVSLSSELLKDHRQLEIGQYVVPLGWVLPDPGGLGDHSPQVASIGHSWLSRSHDLDLEDLLCRHHGLDALEGHNVVLPVRLHIRETPSVQVLQPRTVLSNLLQQSSSAERGDFWSTQVGGLADIDGVQHLPEGAAREVLRKDRKTSIGCVDDDPAERSLDPICVTSNFDDDSSRLNGLCLGTQHFRCRSNIDTFTKDDLPESKLWGLRLHLGGHARRLHCDE